MKGIFDYLPESKVERRRLFEILLMVFSGIVLVAISRLESRLFEISENLSENRDFFISVVYFGLINLNVLVILVLSFLIFRNAVKLVIERRRGVLGSKLKTKLVVTLVFFAVAPTTLLFYISNQYIATSFDTWFSVRVRDTMQQTREAGALVYKQDQRRLESLARIALERVEIVETPQYFPGVLREPSVGRLEGFDREYRVNALKLFNRYGRLLWSSSKELSPEIVEKSLAFHAPYETLFVQDAIERFALDFTLLSIGAVAADEKTDIVKGAAPIVDPRTKQLIGILVAEERFETQILRSIETMLNEFANIRPSAKLIRLSFTVLLVAIVLIIIFSATWLGFYVAKGITGPIQNLAEATREVALGNYEITLMPRSDDETGQLVRSFNSMTKDLARHKKQADESQSRIRATNEELEERRQYMEVVLKNISTGVISIDDKGHITSFNSAAENLLALKASDIVGKSISQSLGPELNEQLWLPIELRLSKADVFSGHIDVRYCGRDLSLLFDATRIYDEIRRSLGVILVLDDASEQAKVQKVAAWREVARRIAHEIKNPITPIKLSAQRLMRRFGGNFSGEEAEVFRSCCEMILTQVDSLKKLVNEFSKFSRLPAIQTKPFQINEIILDVARSYSISYPDISFQLSKIHENIPHISIDVEQMRRVFVNLVNNAVEALSEDVGPKIVSFSSEYIPDLNAVRVSVADNGPGISDSQKNKVLDPYFSTKVEGTGLGLTIVNQIITDHGGYLRIADEKPTGVRFVMDFPVNSRGINLAESQV